MGFFDTIGGWLGDLTSPMFSGMQAQQVPKMNAGQSTALQSQLDYLMQYIQNPSAIPSYGGQFTAPLTSTQSSAMSNVNNYMGSNLPQSGDVMSQIMNMISGKSFDPTNMRKAYASGVEQPMLQNFNQTVLPNIMSSSAKSGNFYGTGREEATKEADQTLSDALSMGRSNLESNIYSKGQDVQQAGIADFSNFISSQGGLSKTAFDMGTVEQAGQQNTLNQLLSQWQSQNVPGKQPYDQLLTSILGMTPYDTTVQSGQQNPLMQLLMAYASS
jgi:hypothetical protein